MDEFEQLLRRQQPRRIPSEWRAEILAAAEEAQRHGTTTQPARPDRVARIPSWRLALARLPLAWAALGTLWIVMLSVNVMLPRPIVTVSVEALPMGRLDLFAAMDLQRVGTGPTAAPSAVSPEGVPAPETRRQPVRSRSERERHTDFAEFGAGSIREITV